MYSVTPETSKACAHIHTLFQFYLFRLSYSDRREWKLSAIDPHDRDTWRSGVRSAMRAASQLPGRGPTVVDMAPIPAR